MAADPWDSFAVKVEKRSRKTRKAKAQAPDHPPDSESEAAGSKPAKVWCWTPLLSLFQGKKSRKYRASSLDFGDSPSVPQIYYEKGGAGGFEIPNLDCRTHGRELSRKGHDINFSMQHTHLETVEEFPENMSQFSSVAPSRTTSAVSAFPGSPLAAQLSTLSLSFAKTPSIAETAHSELQGPVPDVPAIRDSEQVHLQSDMEGDGEEHAPSALMPVPICRNNQQLYQDERGGRSSPDKSVTQIHDHSFKHNNLGRAFSRSSTGVTSAASQSSSTDSTRSTITRSSSVSQAADEAVAIKAALTTLLLRRASCPDAGKGEGRDKSEDMSKGLLRPYDYHYLGSGSEATTTMEGTGAGVETLDGDTEEARLESRHIEREGTKAWRTHLEAVSSQWLQTHPALSSPTVQVS